MVWKEAYYLIKKDNYLKASTLLLCICSISAVALNIEGSNCIRQVNSLALTENSIADDAENNLRNNTGFSNQFQQQVEERRQQQIEQENRQAQEELIQESYELRKYCFLVTNMYVYSLFGVIIGFILLVIWYIRYKRIWAWSKNRKNSL
ncbi:hypothetical protein [Candidatus Nitrosocosmicus hydrocola]|uniref:hypothetical protein n=1 Tax=Candidatus Nitrosocosmicus hydrocola TaxID=1826872 RepID=UPI0011E5E934|nr:hypothetical protein [Candidatus Nitrosocosmicus hydrocola]